MEHEKILPFAACAETFRRIRAEGRRIVHCHGTFDLLHPGHVQHLAQAKRHGEVLVVSITSAPFVNKGPGRPVFSDQQRAYQLAHLALVDWVVVVPATGAVEIIDHVRPHVYCKGLEYAAPQNESDRRVEQDAAAVRSHGGEIVFVGEALHSSTKLLGLHYDTLDPEVRQYLLGLPPQQAEELDPLMARIASLRVLVVGDLIIDKYTYCRAQGLTSKARVLSVRPVSSELQLGGSLAIARHVASFGCQTRLVALTGTEPWLAEALGRPDPGLELRLAQSADYTTIVKERWVERQGERRDLIKYFAANQLSDSPPAPQRAQLLEELKRELAASDLVILCDYGHGMIDPQVQALLEEQSSWLALNCQTNSLNYGFNLITKYRRCELFALDERELCLAYGQRGPSEFELLSRLGGQLKAREGYLTLGSSGSLAWSVDADSHRCPAMTRTTVDTVGAGDAFFAVAALCARAGAALPLTSVLSNLAGAFSANVVGNQEAIHRDAVVKSARYLFKSASPGLAPS